MTPEFKSLEEVEALDGYDAEHMLLCAGVINAKWEGDEVAVVRGERGHLRISTRQGRLAFVCHAEGVQGIAAVLARTGAAVVRGRPIRLAASR